MIWHMDEFDTDYSFLNLPEAGSAVRGPIELPSIEPIDFDLFGATPPADDTGEDDGDTGEGDGGAEGSGIFQRQPIRERGNDQARFEMGRAIGQEVNTLRQNIQTLEAAKGELVSERDDAIQMQDQIRQQMSEQRIQELDQQQARLQAELQEAVAAAEARGIDALAEAEAQAAEELASVSANFQSQIDALTGERDQAIAEQDMIRAEAADQQAQALEMQKQEYEARLGEMTGQVGQFETQLGERDQTIADLQAQIAGLQQAPAETPTVPDIGPIPGPKPIPPQDFGFGPGIRPTEIIGPDGQFIGSAGVTPPDIGPIPGLKEQFPYLDLLSKEQPQEVKDMVARSMATGEAVISPDQVQGMINNMTGQTAFVKAPQMPPKRKDQFFISDQPRFISEERMPRPPADSIPVVGTGTGFIGRPVTTAETPYKTTIRRPVAPIPPAPAITPPRRPMSVGGIGGMGGRINRMMMR